MAAANCCLLKEGRKNERICQIRKYAIRDGRMCRSCKTSSWLNGAVSIKDLMSAMDKIGIQCVSDNNINTDTEIRVLSENNPDYAFQVVYNAKINERNLIFCLASAMGDILLHRLDFSK